MENKLHVVWPRRGLSFSGACEVVFRELQRADCVAGVALAEVARAVVKRLGFEGVGETPRKRDRTGHA